MTGKKPRNPYPLLLRRVLRRILPHPTYRRYVGRHEDESIRLWTWMAARVPPGSAILDIGAFRGAYALAAKTANPATLVYAFEPNPQTAGVLRRASAQSGVEVIEAAVAEQDGFLPFLYDSAQSRLAPGESADSGEQVQQVPTITLDGWRRGKRVFPYLIKIDVEGAETQVLRGATGMLHECRPIILCEVLTNSAGDAVRAALPPQYRFFHIDENRGVREEPRITRRHWRNKNWLLIPEHRQAELAELLRPAHAFRWARPSTDSGPTSSDLPLQGR